jgi:hypothetical protein
VLAVPASLDTFLWPWYASAVTVAIAEPFVLLLKSGVCGSVLIVVCDSLSFAADFDEFGVVVGDAVAFFLPWLSWFGFHIVLIGIEVVGAISDLLDPNLNLTIPAGVRCKRSHLLLSRQ